MEKPSTLTKHVDCQKVHDRVIHPFHKAYDQCNLLREKEQEATTVIRSERARGMGWG